MGGEGHFLQRKRLAKQGPEAGELGLLRQLQGLKFERWGVEREERSRGTYEGLLSKSLDFTPSSLGG